MNNLDQKYVDQVNAYLALPPAEREIEKGAMLMLKGNRNQTLHKNVLRKNWHDKVDYELKKILGSRYINPEAPIVDEKDPFDTVSVEEIETVVANHLESADKSIKGLRADHDQLPLEIQAIVIGNQSRYQQMRALHEKSKLMNAEEFKAEDRKPVLTDLLKLDAELHSEWERYDKFFIGQTTAVKTVVEAIDAKRIQANRTFLSRQAKKEKLDDETLAETQSRFDEMITNKVVISPEITEKLKTLGVKVVVVEISKNKEDVEDEKSEMNEGETTETTKDVEDENPEMNEVETTEKTKDVEDEKPEMNEGETTTDEILNPEL